VNGFEVNHCRIPGIAPDDQRDSPAVSVNELFFCPKIAGNDVCNEIHFGTG
jgi:hypothetical protein